MRAQGLQVHFASNAFGAMALLCRLSSDDDAKATIGSLLLYQPNLVSHANELLHAVASYLPAVRCWQVNEDPSTLRPVSASDVRRWNTDQELPEKSLMGLQPHADGVLHEPAPVAGSKRTDPPSNLLTDDELDLLLSSDLRAQDGPHADALDLGDLNAAQEDGRTDG